MLCKSSNSNIWVCRWRKPKNKPGSVTSSCAAVKSQQATTELRQWAIITTASKIKPRPSGHLTQEVQLRLGLPLIVASVWEACLSKMTKAQFPWFTFEGVKWRVWDKDLQNVILRANSMALRPVGFPEKLSPRTHKKTHSIVRNHNFTLPDAAFISPKLLSHGWLPPPAPNPR